MKTDELINIIIDTNVLRAEPYYKKEEYNSLAILVENKVIKIFLPYLIEHEYLEQLKKDYIDDINKTQSSLARVSSRYNVDSTFCTGISEQISNFESETLKKVVSDFEENFCKRLNVEKVAIKSEHNIKVFEKYFQGETPFKNKKSREDIPDGFIFEAIQDIKLKNDNTVVILKDGEFKKACIKNEITTFKSIEDFIKHSEIQNILSKHKISKENMKKMNVYLSKNQCIKDFLLDRHIDELEYVTITDERIPSDDNTAQIHGVSSAENIRCNLENIIYYSENTIGIPVSFDVEVSAYVLIFKSEYYANESYLEFYSSPEDWNKHYINADGTFLLRVDTDIVLDISQVDFTDEDIDFDIEIENIDFSMNDINDVNVIKIISNKPKEYSTIKCEQCQSEELIDCDNLEWEQVGGSERNMGAEYQYEAKYIFNCSCGNEVTAIFSTCEYPVGVVNHCDVYITNGEIESNCCYEPNKNERGWSY